jgi:hypothetical protein
MVETILIIDNSIQRKGRKGMPLSGTSLAFDTYYTSLDSSLGCYVIDPETGPYIVIDSNQDAELKELILDRLTNYHNSIPADSAYRLFKMVTCYEDLPEPQPEIIILGSFKPKSRCFYCSQHTQTYRLIGS